MDFRVHTLSFRYFIFRKPAQFHDIHMYAIMYDYRENVLLAEEGVYVRKIVTLCAKNTLY